jgi:hypothetical protein
VAQARDPGQEDPRVEITIKGLAMSQKDDAIVLTRPEKGTKITGMALSVVIFCGPKIYRRETCLRRKTKGREVWP